MTTKLSALHKTVGAVTVIIFIGTGLLMRFHFSRIYEANLLERCFIFSARRAAAWSRNDAAVGFEKKVADS